MKAEIRSFASVHALKTLAEHQPADLGRFRLLLDIYVSMPGELGEELFTVTLRSPVAGEILTEGDLGLGYQSVIARRFDWPRIEAFIRRKIEALDATDWDDLILQVRRYAAWSGNSLAPPPDLYPPRDFQRWW